ncbi:hypothetical protein EVAR_47834_1 [Eumeta japonica]|uniref:Uncharacterized protein n=1 Tax=Eumeta variegata TaxID=151549 RepID=A0A4C1XSW0_EUMVA|nr:hypothetical protein EVAR_47834_1 [Eumeta japonica]
MITAAHGHSQLQRNLYCVIGLLERNKISDNEWTIGIVKEGIGYLLKGEASHRNSHLLNEMAVPFRSGDVRRLVRGGEIISLYGDGHTLHLAQRDYD